jgi:hypothetical protein
MRGKNFPTEMIYQVFSLLLVFIIVHGCWSLSSFMEPMSP